MDILNPVTLFDELPEEKFTTSFVADYYCVICTKDFCLFNIPENHSIYFGKIRIMGSFIMRKGDTVNLVKVAENATYILTCIGMPYVCNFEILEESMWSRFKRCIKGYFTDFMCS